MDMIPFEEWRSQIRAEAERLAKQGPNAINEYRSTVCWSTPIDDEKSLAHVLNVCELAAEICQQEGMR